MQIQDFDYPEDEDSFVESDDSELNPFLFELDEQKSAVQRVETLFKHMQQNDQVTKIVDILCDVNFNLKKLRKYALLIQKEHQMFQVLKKAYEDLKSKTINHDRFIISLEKGYEKQIQELQNELEQLQMQNKQQNEELTKTIQNLKEQLSSKQQLIQIKDEEIKFIKQNETHLQNQVISLSSEYLKCSKENTTIKKIKTQNLLSLNEKQDFPYSTFELVVTTKLKSKLIPFLSPKDLLNLFLTKKSLYFALCQFKLIVPHAIQYSTISQNNQIKNLTKQVETFKRLYSDCSEPIIKTQLIKLFDLQQLPTEFIDPVINEASNFIKGKQITDKTEVIEDPDSTQGLQMYLKNMGMGAGAALQTLKTNPFHLSQLSQILCIQASDKEQYIRERGEQIKKLKKSQSEINEQLFSLGQIAAADPGLYSMYISSMTRLFSNLFVYSSQLQADCRIQLCLLYYLVVQHWQTIEKLKILEQMNLDKQDRIKNNGNEIKALYEQIRGLQSMIKQQQQELSQHNKAVDKIEQEKSQLKVELKEVKNLLLNYGKNIKLLAIEIRELRKQKEQMTLLNNENALQIDNVKQQLNKINI